MPVSSHGSHPNSSVLRRRLDRLLEEVVRLRSIDPTASLDKANASISLAESLRDCRLSIAALRERARCHMGLHDLSAALADLYRASVLDNDHDDTPESAELTAGLKADLAQLELQTGDCVNAAGHYQQALDLFQSCNLADGIARSLEGLGVVYQESGDYAKALEYYLQLLEQQRQLGNADAIGAAATNVAIIYGIMDDSEMALIFFQESLEHFHRSGNLYLEVRTLTNIASLNCASGDLKPALDSAMGALMIYDSLNDHQSLRSTFTLIGTIHERYNQPATAMEYYRKALDVVTDSNDEEIGTQLLLNIGRVHALTGNSQEALLVLEEALPAVRRLGNRNLEMSVCQVLAETLEQLGNVGRALEQYKLYMKLHQEMHSQEQQRIIARMHLRFEIERVEHEKERLHHQTEQLKREVEFKAQELSNLALTMVEKSSLLTTIHRRLTEIADHAPEEAQVSLHQLQDEIKTDMQSNAAWNTFEEQFQRVHGEFIQRISSRCPELTPMELKVCALLKINLATKEIAEMLHTSVRNVDTRRYWIRKKLGLATGSNLTTFLAGV